MAHNRRSSAITIEDVARASGVSRQTVSRVINNKPNVKLAVRERIEAAIDKLGYVPNLSARRMGGARSYLILAVNDRQRTIENWRVGRGNDWVDQMLFGGMMTCEDHGYHMLFELIDTDSDIAVKKLDRVLSSVHPDGVILTPPHSDNPALLELLDRRKTRGIRIGGPDSLGGPSVYMDERGAAASATCHLIELGHKRIAFVAGSAEYGSSSKRIGGYRDALDEAGLPPEPSLVVQGDFHFDRAAKETRRLLERSDRPTAMIAENDEMAFAVLHVADEVGMAVPKDLSLISFEDTPGARFSVPPLTSIRQPTAAMIAKSCELLIAASQGERIPDAVELPYRLVIRETTGVCPS